MLREYLRAVPVTWPYLDVGPDDPFDRSAEAAKHPVLSIVD